MNAYKPGEMVPVTSALYHVVHDPAEAGEHLQTFYAGDKFPPCPRCEIKVRYLIRVTALKAR